jgi:hypothetical protein
VKPPYVKGWMEKMTEVDERLYQIKKEFDGPISKEVLIEIECVNQSIGTITPEDLLRQFTI